MGVVIVRKETWGPDVPGDPRYRSGRASICKPPELEGEELARQTVDLGLQPLERGSEHSWLYTFDAAGLSGGEIHVCSEYGSVKLVGVEGTELRLRLSVANAFPDGADAVKDTQVTAQVRKQAGQLLVGVWQLTQGVRAFRTLLTKGSRPTNLNVLLELPRNGVYGLRLTANHHRVTVQGLDVHGIIEGYISPGADLDAGLAGDLTLRVDGGSNFRLPGGTTAKLRPLRSGILDVKANKGEVRITITGPAGLDVTAKGADGRGTINIGPTEASLESPEGTHGRSVGFARAAIQIKIKASSPEGAVTVSKAIQ